MKMKETIEKAIEQAGQYAHNNLSMKATEPHKWQGIFLGRYTELVVKDVLEDFIKNKFNLNSNQTVEQQVEEYIKETFQTE